MRRNKRMTMTGWLGIAALGAMQYMGPRPLFVKTAYAAPACDVVSVDASTPADEQLVLDRRVENDC